MLTRPARGTRPANRRELVLTAAEELFYRRGYSKVSMKDIADEVAVGPSALYRHFRNKHDLLEAVVSDGLTAVQKLLEEHDDAQSALTALAGVMLERRAIGVLWHREARHLTDAAPMELRRQLRGIGNHLADLLRHDRPELSAAQAGFLAWATIGVATSVSFHSLDVEPALLADLIREAAATTVPPLEARAADVAAPPWAPSRREEILTAATGLFAAQSYSDVGLEDIGAAVGIAGASVYNHFDSKAQILDAAMMRGNDLLRADLHRELARATGPADALRRLAVSYREFSFENVDLIRVLNAETDQLPDSERHRARVAQRDYIATWMQLVRQVLPDVDDLQARARVQAALNTMNDIATTPSLRQRDGVGAATDAVCLGILLRQHAVERPLSGRSGRAALSDPRAESEPGIQVVRGSARGVSVDVNTPWPG